MKNLSISLKFVCSEWLQRRRSVPTETPPKFGWNRGGVSFWAENLRCKI